MEFGNGLQSAPRVRSSGRQPHRVSFMVDVSDTPTPAPDGEPDSKARALRIDPPAPPSELSASAQATKSAVDNDAPFLWWRRRDQIVFGSLLVVTLLLMGVHWARMSGLGMQPVNIDRHAAREFEFQLDINTANWVEWTQLDGIGDQLARRIVADREKNGPFESVEDLNRVPGIGPKTLERLRPWVQHRSEEDASNISRR
jgi:competence protein ComEA